MTCLKIFRLHTESVRVLSQITEGSGKCRMDTAQA